jgi:hypothetical protein
MGTISARPGPEIHSAGKAHLGRVSVNYGHILLSRGRNRSISNSDLFMGPQVGVRPKDRRVD